MTPAVEQTGISIADQLGEKDALPREQIQRIVERLGADTALTVLNETLAREAQGGMMLPDGSRRRTPGGVYFYIIRRRVTKEDWAFINPASQEQAVPHPPATWEDRLAVLGAALQEPGTIMTVKITLTGRPGRIIERNDYIVTSLRSAKAPQLPKGLPPPPGTPTIYVTFIPKKSWAKVAEALKNPEAILVVGGYPILDQQAKGIAVLAQSVSVKLPPGKDDAETRGHPRTARAGGDAETKSKDAETGK